jgi:hypothetical protein
MWQELVAWLVATFLVGPLQASLNEALTAARAPAATLSLVADCAAAASPALATRAASEPVWLVQTAIGVWIGTLRPEAVLGDAAPACAPALAAARPFLGSS